MMTYTFNAIDSKGNVLGRVGLKSDCLPSHLNICMAVLAQYHTATEYAMVCNKQELNRITINPERYLAHEFRAILQDCNRSWMNARVEVTDGDHKGEHGNIVGFSSSKNGSHFTVVWDKKCYGIVDSSDLRIIKLVQDENTDL